MSGEIYRYDRHGRKSLVSTDQSRAALAKRQAVADRGHEQERAALKARQDAGQLTPQERMLSGIFGEIK